MTPECNGKGNIISEAIMGVLLERRNIPTVLVFHRNVGMFT